MREFILINLKRTTTYVKFGSVGLVFYARFSQFCFWLDRDCTRLVRFNRSNASGIFCVMLWPCTMGMIAIQLFQSTRIAKLVPMFLSYLVLRVRVIQCSIKPSVAPPLPSPLFSLFPPLLPLPDEVVRPSALPNFFSFLHDHHDYLHIKSLIRHVDSQIFILSSRSFIDLLLVLQIKCNNIFVLA